MARVFGIIAAIGALALTGVATEAAAQSKPKARPEAVPSFAADPGAWGPAGSGPKSFQWNSSGRWGLKLDYDQPTSRDVQWKDVDVGASFKITPRFRVGGALRLDSQAAPTRALPDEKPQPRVRLETTFRF